MRTTAITLIAALWGMGALAQTSPATTGASTGKRIVVVQTLPMSGPLANVGEDIATATRAYFAQFNKSRAPSQQVELRVVDDGNDQAKAQLGIAQIVASAAAGSAPVAIVSCFGTVSCLGAMAASKAARVPLIGPIAGAPVFRAPEQSTVYAVRPSAVTEVAKLLEYVKFLQLSKLAVYVQDDGFGKGYLGPTLEQIKAVGLAPPQVITLNPQAPDYAQAASAVEQAKPDAIIMLANVKHSAEFVSAIAKAGASPWLMNLAGQANAGFVKSAAGSRAFNVFAAMTPSPWRPSISVVREYQAAWQAATGNTAFSYLTLEAYINAKVLGEAITRTRGDVNAASIQAALTSGVIELGGIDARFVGGKRVGTGFVDLAVLDGKGVFKQ